jgi:hypothetical protein
MGHLLEGKEVVGLEEGLHVFDSQFRRRSIREEEVFGHTKIPVLKKRRPEESANLAELSRIKEDKIWSVWLIGCS